MTTEIDYGEATDPGTATLPRHALRAILDALKTGSDYLDRAMEDQESGVDEGIYDAEEGEGISARQEADDALMTRAIAHVQAALEGAEPPKRDIVIEIQGGLITGISSPEPMPDVRLTVIDRDVENTLDGELNDLMEIGGDPDDVAFVTVFEDGPEDRAPVPELKAAPEDDEDEDDDPERDRFHLSYRCPGCKVDWTDNSPCVTDDRCPRCGLTCSPSDVEDL